MSYVDETYYNDTFHGEPVDPADFPGLCLRAEEIVEEMTGYRLTPECFQTMPENSREKVKMAVCAEMEYLDANGGNDLDNGLDLQSAGLGKYSYHVTPGSDGAGKAPVYAPRALRLLMPTGLLYRGRGSG